jgi:uncharacterized protein
MSDRFLYTNRLINQKSPYLLQHAHNPVDWYPWGEEAFIAAKELDRPIFLSIGYATCHWCHVMEKESFENLEVANLLNETFINIKVDREELPEVDGLYMEFAQSMMIGAAGWPLNIILTPDLQPFFAATYLPPENLHGLMGLGELISRINEVWSTEDRERVLMQASKIVEIFESSLHVRGEEMPEKEVVENTAELLFKMADPIYGGMKGVPKFPIGYQSNFMIRYSSLMKDSRALFVVEKTLDMMQRGGIYDHLGGGFSRYSTDEKWLVPHFEKMLYDNAILAYSYLEAFRATKHLHYRNVCEQILNYILRDMNHPEGGFYSAEDADSEGHEGLFYTWTIEEVQSLLGKKDSLLFCEFFDITPQGNFEGRNILNTPLRIEEFASKKGLSIEELNSKFLEQKDILWKAREMREHPFKDDKILSSWNGLMIFSFVEAGVTFGEKKYIDAAVNAARFIKKYMWTGEQMVRRWRDNEALYNAGLDEYAFLIRGLLSLFEANCGSEWLEWAIKMSQILKINFQVSDGAFFQTDGQDPNIILRKCQFSDGAEPSGNAIHCENLLRLYKITLDSSDLNQAECILKAVKKYIDNYPPGYCYHIMNLNHYYDRHAPTLVVALNDENEYEADLRFQIFQSFIPHKAVIWRKSDDNLLLKIVPFVLKQTPIEGKTTLYICYHGVCQKPITNFSEMVQAIRKL